MHVTHILSFYLSAPSDNPAWKQLGYTHLDSESSVKQL